MGATALTAHRARRVIEVMGTVVSVDVRRVGLPLADVADVADALGALEDWLRWVDLTFSTYRPDSQVSRLGRQELRLADCHPQVAAVLDACADAHAATDGCFTTMVGGRLDPTGLVKGWAAQRASALLRTAGLSHHAVNAGGDVVCAGEPSDGQPWRVGISDPHRHGRLLTTVHLRDAAVATSGTAERGAHVVDPRTGRPAHVLAAVTVVGPDLAAADAYATAALAADDERPPWVDRLPGYEALMVGADGTHVGWTRGFPAYTTERTQSLH